MNLPLMAASGSTAKWKKQDLYIHMSYFLSMRNNKAQGLSINMLVIIALAVFVIFLIVGFVTSGWGYFSKSFSSVKVEGGTLARQECLNWCTHWKAQGSPTIGSTGEYWHDTLCGPHNDVDFENDGTNDVYSCRGTVTATSPATAHSEILTEQECPVTCS